MKITKRQLRRIIKEEKSKILKEQSDFPTDEQVAKIASSLGHNLAGHPNVVKEIRAALTKVFPIAAEAFWNSYTNRQEELDMIYSSYDN